MSIPSPFPPTRILKITAESLYQRLHQPAGFHNKASEEQALLGENVSLLLIFCLNTDILSFKEPEASLKHGLLKVSVSVLSGYISKSSFSENAI